MASTYKVAIAVALLEGVDQGQLKLSDLIDVSPEMMVAGDNAIAETFIHPGIKLSVANLIEVMITASDNTATEQARAVKWHIFFDLDATCFVHHSVLRKCSE